MVHRSDLHLGLIGSRTACYESSGAVAAAAEATKREPAGKLMPIEKLVLPPRGVRAGITAWAGSSFMTPRTIAERIFRKDILFTPSSC
jgi:hypothetical protein